MSMQDQTCRLAAKLAMGIAIAFGTTAGGCGSHAKVEDRSTAVSLGQQLEDLDDAHKKGLLTDKEFKDKRKEIMKNQ
jgi:hypothetical protein